MCQEKEYLNNLPLPSFRPRKKQSVMVGEGRIARLTDRVACILGLKMRCARRLATFYLVDL